MFRTFKLMRNCNFLSLAATQLKKTSLYDFHLKNNAKMFNFFNWNMPLQYSTPSYEHNCVRSFFGIFDVSHMKQVTITGDDAAKFLDYSLLANIHKMQFGACQYTAMLNSNAQVLDDLIVTKDSDDCFYAVLNCSQAQSDLLHLNNIIQEHAWNVKIEEINSSLLAIQGPQSSASLQRGFDIKLNSLKFLSSLWPVTAFGIPNCRLSRVGYTGEDGFELMVPNDCAEFVTMELLGFSKNGRTGTMVGLSARDSLRIEAGLCLYGSELDSSINIKDAGLKWLLSPEKVAAKSFLGCEALLPFLGSPPAMIRVGIVANKKAPLMRAGSVLFNSDNERIGRITSCCVGNSVGSHIAMAYINYAARKIDQVIFEVRGKQYSAQITKLPFIKPKYYTHII